MASGVARRPEVHVCGYLLADVVSGQQTELDLTPYRLSR